MKKGADPIIEKAAKNVGGFPALAKELKITRHAIYQWKRIPPKWVGELERLTGIPRQELRPDLFREAS